MAEIHSDIVIIGAGAAGLHVALTIHNDPYFDNMSIVLIDKTNKDVNDRTWCYWEKGSGKWDHISKHSWTHGSFFSNWGYKHFDLSPYRYKMLPGLDFYNYSKAILLGSKKFKWYQDEISEVIHTKDLLVKGKDHVYSATYVLDSRMPDEFIQASKSNKPILQHFKGWVIKTDQDFFNSDQFTMMDYRMSWKDETSFFYVLPIHSREALIEFTLFNMELLGDLDYDFMLKRYITEILHLDHYEIVEQEYGIIPMSTFRFESLSNGNHILIGTAGGWVKPSSGYSFKNAERNALKLIRNIKDKRNINYGIISKRFRFYDTLFLDVLKHHNDLGPKLFTLMYTKNDVRKIFKFLDEETNVIEELNIIWHFPKIVFMKSLLKYFFQSIIRKGYLV